MAIQVASTTSAQLGTSANVMPSNSAGFTMCGWFYRGNDATYNSQGRKLMGVSDADTDGVALGMSASTSAAKLILIMNPSTGGSTTVATGSTSIFGGTTSSDKWFFGAVTFDHTTNLWQLYYGDETTTVASAASAYDSSALTGYWPDKTASNRAYAAGNATSYSGFYWNTGDRAAYCRMWEKKLSLAELEAEQYRTTAQTSAVWADWPLTDASTLTDASGNGRTVSALLGTFTDGGTGPENVTAGASGAAKMASYYRMLRSA